MEREIPNVTIRFKREDSRQWLIFPTKQWRVTEVLIPAESVADMPSFGFPYTRGPKVLARASTWNLTAAVVSCRQVLHGTNPIRST